MDPVTKMSDRKTSDNLVSILRHLPSSRWFPEILAGITLLAIAIPEQLATAQLAEVPAFLAILAFITASLLFAVFGSNPILSVGADSTIAPLFAVALVRLAEPQQPDYLVLVSATAVVAGILIALVGLFRLGWIADFLSMPIVAGFMTGIGLTIIVHQLPNGLGLSGVTGTFAHRVSTIITHLGSAHGWTVALAFGTLVVVVVGEKINARLPFALFAVVVTTLITHFAHLAAHGVATLGTVHVESLSWRLSGFHWSDAGTVATTALTIAVVILSQSAATSRNVADDLCIDVDVNRDFVAIGLANIASGVVGSIPVNASPARTGVVKVAGGRTQVVGLTAAVGALLIIPCAPALADLPLAALAGVLMYVASRLLKITTLRQIARVDRYEVALAIVTGLAVIFIGVQEGIAVAVLLAILDQTRRSARPHVVELGRRPGTTSWERIGAEGSQTVDHASVLLFGATLYFANAAIFRAEVHDVLRKSPLTTHVVIDAAAMVDIDFTGLSALTQVVTDLQREHVVVVLARANDSVLSALARAPSPELNAIVNYETVDEAVSAIAPGA